jgi:hypothetical protein
LNEKREREKRERKRVSMEKREKECGSTYVSLNELSVEYYNRFFE